MQKNQTAQSLKEQREPLIRCHEHKTTLWVTSHIRVENDRFWSFQGKGLPPSPLCARLHTHTHTHTRVRMHALAGSRSFQPSVFQRANPPLPHLTSWKVHFLPDRQEFLAPALPTLFPSPFPLSHWSRTQNIQGSIYIGSSVWSAGDTSSLMQSPYLRSTIKSHLRQWISLSTALENLFTPF